MYDYKYTIYKEMYNKNERNAKFISYLSSYMMYRYIYIYYYFTN